MGDKKRRGSRGSRNTSLKRKDKMLKIGFWVTESILLAVVIACAIILKLLSGITVLKRPEDEVNVNDKETTSIVQAEQTTQSTTTSGEITVSTEAEIPTEEYTPFAGKEYTTIAVLGLDGRGDVESVYQGSNSDVIILVSINNETGAIKMCSVYRDTLMKLDAGDGTDSEIKYAKANLPMCKYGIMSAVNTLNCNLDLNIDYYVTINWASAVDIINELGGVDITLKRAYYDIASEESTTGRVEYLNGLIAEIVDSVKVDSFAIPEEYFEDGTVVHADGVQAVAYMRLRYCDSDLYRTMRQREVIQKMVERAKQADLGTLLKILDIIKANIKLDIDQTDLIGLLSNITKYHIEDTAGYPSNLYGGGDYTGSMQWMIIPVNVVENVRELHKFLYNQTNYTPSVQLKAIDDEIRQLGLFDENWNITIETKEY